MKFKSVENSYYILSKQQVEIERLHICTWDVVNESTFVEFGIEIKNTQDLGTDVELNLVLPFINKNCEITSLHQQLLDESSCRFIFNEILKNKALISGDIRNGGIVEFETREKLAILPVDCIIDHEKNIVRLKIKKPTGYDGSIYSRVLIQTNHPTLSTKKSGIAKNSWIYDIKINETRNLPDNVYTIKRDGELSFCKIQKVFCLHSIPDNYEIVFFDSKRLKNIRKLEIDAFKKYLPYIKSLNKDKYIIIFQKDGGADSYSFFSCFSNETIGNRQIVLAVGANIFCSLLFAAGSLRLSVSNPCLSFLQRIPYEYWVAGAIFISLIAYIAVWPLFKRVWSYVIKRI